MVLDMTALSVGIAGAIIVIGVFLINAQGRTKISGVIPLLGLGILLGPILGLFNPAKYAGAISSLITLALVVVLFDVGYGLSFEQLKKGIVPAVGLTVLSALITSVAIGSFAIYVLGLSFPLALLLASIVVSTDLTIVAPLLEKFSFDKRTTNVIDLEATLNSVAAAVMAIIAVNMIQLEAFGAAQILQTFLYNVSVGAVFGVFLGWIIVAAVRRLNIEEKPHIISIGAVLLTYSIAELVGASGIIAALVVGIVFRNMGQELPRLIKKYGGDLELLLITFIYVILGTLLDFKALLSSIVISIAFLVLVLIARLMAAKIFTIKEKTSDNLKLIFFSSPRGMITAVLVLSYAPLFIGMQSAVIAMVLFTIIVSTVLSSVVPMLASEPKKLASAKKANISRKKVDKKSRKK